MSKLNNPSSVVMSFLEEVRSGKKPENAKNYMASEIKAHQIDSENPITILRTPANYTEHVKEFLEMYGNYKFEICELITQSNKVFVRWQQTSYHMKEIEGFSPTGKQIKQFGSAVYRVENNLIEEYWIQTDRYGLLQQLKTL